MGGLTPRDPPPDDDPRLEALRQEKADLRGARNALVPAERPGVDKPAASLAQAAGLYGQMRARLDNAIAHAESDADLLVLTRDVIERADELARRVVNNPTSRIRPAFDRRFKAKDGSTVHPKNLTTPIREATFLGQLGADEGALPWDVAQRIFHAKMDFLSWRIANGLNAVSDIRLQVEFELHCRVVPAAVREEGPIPDSLTAVVVTPEEKATYSSRDMRGWTER